MRKLGQCVMVVMLSYWLSACAAVQMQQALQSGKQTFDAGNFTAAFQQLMPLAVKGSPEAQYAVGYMYYYGLGVMAHPESGLFWINLSASNLYPPAVKALQVIHDDKLPRPASAPVPPAQRNASAVDNAFSNLSATPTLSQKTDEPIDTLADTLDDPSIQKRLAWMKQEKEVLENPVRVAARLTPENEQDDIWVSLSAQSKPPQAEIQQNAITTDALQETKQSLPALAYARYLPASVAFCEKNVI